MKKSIFLILLLFSFAANNAKGDVIILKTGDSKNVYNIEISGNYIFFNETANEDSNISKLSKTDVFGYKIGDGDIQILDTDKSSPSISTSSKSLPSKSTASVTTDAPQEYSTPTLLNCKIAEDNSYILARLADFTITPKKNNSGLCGGKITPVWAFSENSVISDENLSINVDRFDFLIGGVAYKIKLTNKTDKMLFVDLTNTFETNRDGIAKPFFTNKIYTTNEGHSSGGSLNLGAIAGAVGIGGVAGTLANGITVGGGNTKGATVSESQSPVISIPPHSSKYLPGEKVKIGGDYDYMEMPLCMYFITAGRHLDNKLAFAYQHNYLKRLIFWDGILPIDDERITCESIGLTKNGYVEFEEELAPKRRDFTITYSDSPQFTTYYQLPLGFYIKGFFGGQFENLTKECIVTGNGFPMFGVGQIKKK